MLEGKSISLDTRNQLLSLLPIPYSLEKSREPTHMPFYSMREHACCLVLKLSENVQLQDRIHLV